MIREQFCAPPYEAADLTVVMMISLHHARHAGRRHAVLGGALHLRRDLVAVGAAGLVALSCAVAPPPSDTGGLAAGGRSVTCVNPGAGGDPGGAVGGAGGTAPTTARELPWLHVEGNQIKDTSGNTVVLRGVAFADLGEVQISEGGINKMIDRVTNVSDVQGCSPSWETRVVRLTVSPADGDVNTPIQYRAGGTYYDNVLRPTIDYARSKGVYAIIDWHYIDDTNLHQASTAEFWADIAPRFANDSNVLFELFNEPINNGSWPSVRADMQRWTDIVRAAAPNNLILVGTPNWCQYVGNVVSNPIAGTNIVYVAHMYPEHWKQISLRNQITTALANHPVIITEWGFEQSTNTILDGTVTSYGNAFRQFVDDRRISWTAWCASRSWRPVMFTSSYGLLVGEGSMGGFVKDWLYDKRDSDQPAP
jgi:hypothetical protein